MQAEMPNIYPWGFLFISFYYSECVWEVRRKECLISHGLSLFILLHPPQYASLCCAQASWLELWWLQAFPVNPFVVMLMVFMVLRRLDNHPPALRGPFSWFIQVISYAFRRWVLIMSIATWMQWSRRFLADGSGSWFSLSFSGSCHHDSVRAQRTTFRVIWWPWWLRLTWPRMVYSSQALKQR